MMGKSKGFVSKVKQTNPDVQITRCFLHREAMRAKTLPDELKEVLDTAIKLVNFTKTSSLKLQLFEILMQRDGSRSQGLASTY